MELFMNRKYIILLLLSVIAFGNTELEKHDSQSSEILESILSGYSKNVSFSLDLIHSKGRLAMNVNMLHVDKDSLAEGEYLSNSYPVRKIFAEVTSLGKPFRIWIWEYSDDRNMIWFAEKGKGKIVDASRFPLTQFLLPVDISSIQFDESILKQFCTTLDIINYNGIDSYLIDFYKCSKSRKKRPAMKAWISILDNQIIKIEKLNRKGKLISEIVFKEYFEGFPKVVIIKEAKSGNESTINISNYKEVSFENLNIFNPIHDWNEK